MASQTTAHAAPTAAAPAPKPLDAAEVRNVIAAQPTVAGGVAALVQGISGIISQALKSADPSGLQQFADALSADSKSWADAVQANTPEAVQTTAQFVAVPSHLQEVFTKHAAAQAQKPAEGAKAAH